MKITLTINNPQELTVLKAAIVLAQRECSRTILNANMKELLDISSQSEVHLAVLAGFAQQIDEQTKR